MNNNRIVFVLIAFIVSAFASQASASPAAVMRVIGKANPPIGHYEFCQTYQSECQPTSLDTGPMKLTEERWK
ncbi:transglutaminase-like cysteine peptidase, partial [Salmonella enterica]